MLGNVFVVFFLLSVVRCGSGLCFFYVSGIKFLDGYMIKCGIGVGGFGEVYFVISDVGKEVVLKWI